MKNRHSENGSNSELESNAETIGEALLSKPVKAKMSRKKKIKIILAAISGLILVLLLIVYFIWRSMIGQVNIVDAKEETLPSEFDIPEESLVNPVPSEKHVINILLLGVDSRDPTNFDGRSDSMMILTVNEKQNRIKLTSLQRDMLVNLPGRDDPEKINAAHVYGGPNLAMRVVNQTFRLDIKHYVVVNMGGMREIIDIAGGVMIDVQAEEIPYINRPSDPVPVTESGPQLLPGRQAVNYARIRKLDSDFVRMERQRIVMQALMDAFLDADLNRQTKMISAGLGLITTNMTPGEITDLGLKILPKMNSNIEQMQLPIEGHFLVDDRSSWVIRSDFNAMIPKLHTFIWGKTFDFDPVQEIPGAPGSRLPLPTLPPTPTPWPTATPQPTPTPEPIPEPTPEPTLEPSQDSSSETDEFDIIDEPDETDELDQTDNSGETGHIDESNETDREGNSDETSRSDTDETTAHTQADSHDTTSQQAAENNTTKTSKPSSTTKPIETNPEANEPDYENGLSVILEDLHAC